MEERYLMTVQLEKLREDRRILLSILNNFMCNASIAYLAKDWEMLKISYDTAQFEREEAGLPRFIGGPNLENV